MTSQFLSVERRLSSATWFSFARYPDVPACAVTVLDGYVEKYPLRVPVAASMLYFLKGVVARLADSKNIVGGSGVNVVARGSMAALGGGIRDRRRL